MQGTYSELEIRILAREDRGYPIEITFAGQEFPRGYLAPDIVPWIGFTSPEEDGQRLFERLFAEQALDRAWTEASGRHAQRRIRLRIDSGAPELHALPWELMRDSTAGEGALARGSARSSSVRGASGVSCVRMYALSVHPVQGRLIVGS